MLVFWLPACCWQLESKRRPQSHRLTSSFIIINQWQVITDHLWGANWFSLIIPPTANQGFRMVYKLRAAHACTSSPCSSQKEDTELSTSSPTQPSTMKTAFILALLVAGQCSVFPPSLGWKTRFVSFSITLILSFSFVYLFVFSPVCSPWPSRLTGG